jgi:hypothetical protein
MEEVLSLGGFVSLMKILIELVVVPQHHYHQILWQ